MRSLPIATVVSAALAACTVMSCRHSVRVPETADTAVVCCSIPQDEVRNDVTAELWQRADSTLAGMTLRAKAAQCLMPTIYAVSDLEGMARLEYYRDSLKAGGIVLLKGDLKSAAALSRASQHGDVPMFVAIDAEWGLAMRLADAPVFPRNGRLGPYVDESDMYDYGAEVARECRRTGIDMVLGPVLDVARSRRGIGWSRSFGDDPLRVSELGTAYARGLESGGVISVAKHFPGHGAASGDSHKSLPVIGLSMHQLDSVDLRPFRHYISSGLSGIMVGHLSVPALDSELMPAAVSPTVVHDLLREELGFGGLVLTDALNMAGANGHTAADAIAAGADLVLGPDDTEREIRGIVERVQRGDLAESVLDERCRRILFYKYLRERELGAVDSDSLVPDVRRGAGAVDRRLRAGRERRS